MEKYKLYQSKLIKDNHQLFIKNCEFAHNLIKHQGFENSTWNYDGYNIFSITGSSTLFYDLFKELNYYIRDFIGDNRPLWIQSWLNYHKGSEVEKELQYHSHKSEYHGYISIDPQDTTTIFKNGTQIQNKIGQIYIGPGNNEDETNTEWDHYVKINSSYDDIRITLGFDICTIPNTLLSPSFFPLL